MAILALANEVVAGIAQAIATVTAVVIGYGLSVVSDRKARRSVLDAQVKDRRLEALVEIIDNLMQSREAIMTAHASLSRMQGPSNLSGTSKASHEATLATAQRSLQPLIADAAQNSRVVARLSLTIQVLGANSNLQSSASEAAEQCRSATHVLRSAISNPANASTELESTARRLDLLVERLLEAGREAG